MLFFWHKAIHPSDKLCLYAQHSFVCVCFFLSATALADEELEMLYASEGMISLPTGADQPLSRAPAVASVITAEDIAATGAIDINDALESVPGFHVSRTSRSYLPSFIIRGIHTDLNQQVLVLINGIPITSPYFGERGQAWTGMPVKNISRIEVVRGPGSALYGADAFAGTINIITKSAGEIDGTEVGASVSSNNINSTWFLHGQRIDNTDIAFSFEYMDNNSVGGIIDIDAQTQLDLKQGTSASRAPSSANIRSENLDIRLDIKYEEWQLRAGYVGRNNLGTGAGIGPTLDPNGIANFKRLNADLNYENNHSFRDWQINAQLSHFDSETTADLFLSPEGVEFPNGAIFPNGVIGNPEIYDRRTNFGASGFYFGIPNHRIRIGGGVNLIEVDRIRESKNFIIDDGLLPAPINTDVSVIDVSDNPDLVFHLPSSRTNPYVFIQDEWNFNKDWSLTTGIRWDNYSDFGSTTNPRIALIWHPEYDITAKLLYGRAFRAPSFAELRNINNPVFLGNPDLDPETIDTFELAIISYPNDYVTTNINFFYYIWDDFIRFAPNAIGTSLAQNTNNQSGWGLEWESQWQIHSRLNLLMNYAYTKANNEETNSDAANAPQQQFYVRSSWVFADNWWLTTQLNWVADRKRERDDPRDEIDDFIWLDLGLKHKLRNIPLTFSLSIRNALDQDAREPTLNGNPTPSIPSDLPLPGIHGFLSVEYKI